LHVDIFASVINSRHMHGETKLIDIIATNVSLKIAVLAKYNIYIWIESFLLPTTKLISYKINNFLFLM